MQIDRNAIDRLLTLNDRQLKSVISRLVDESGIDPSEYRLDPSSIDSIRHALSSATDEELLRIARQYEANKKR